MSTFLGPEVTALLLELEKAAKALVEDRGRATLYAATPQGYTQTGEAVQALNEACALLNRVSRQLGKSASVLAVIRRKARGWGFRA